VIQEEGGEWGNTTTAPKEEEERRGLAPTLSLLGPAKKFQENQFLLEKFHIHFHK
jgi:hypothetical protein